MTSSRSNLHIVQRWPWLERISAKLFQYFHFHFSISPNSFQHFYQIILVFPLNHFSISTATNWTFNLIVAMTFLFLTQWLTRWIQELEKKTASYHQTQYSWVAGFSMITERIDTIGNCPGVEPSISTQVWPSLVGQPFSLYCLRPKEGEGDSLFVKILRRHVKCFLPRKTRISRQFCCFLKGSSFCHS